MYIKGSHIYKLSKLHIYVYMYIYRMSPQCHCGDEEHGRIALSS